MAGSEPEWPRSGLHRFQVVRCVVTAHRGRFGVEVRLTEPPVDVPAFIDFVMLTDADEHLTPDEFPPVGTVLSAAAIDFMPSGELRLSARPSDVESG
ncbi:hypothetical protein [Spongiactinospora sp. TRM90649]|uniref:hypothetical protein n=1 Tax=Spongiactinospora sp. TRM90649 TaxID=3031114 RepID=UPI0023F81ABC|nr:hypothetical protein [Spongiactinospora sp. TRM90649]MDF5757492.1 hypothetical protein [Spongiactinospora sp. TRM90649]